MRALLGCGLGVLGWMCAPVWAEAGCAATVDDAVARHVSRQLSGPRMDAGFRVVGLRNDALAGGTWALVEHCGSTATPLRAVRLPGAWKRAETLVHTGDAITVRVISAASSMELHGWAEESGAVSAKIRVRLPRLLSDGGEAPRIRCVVTGIGTAEVLQ